MDGADGLLLFFSINYLAQGLMGVVYEPIAYLLKDGLGLSASGASGFVFWMTLPFLIKPAFGLLTDLIPLGGRRRVPHLVVASGLSAAAWLALAAVRRYRYGPLLALLTATNVGLVSSDVICDAVMVEQGQRLGRTGFFQSVQITTLYAALVVTGLVGGWLSAHVSMSTVFLIGGACSSLVLISARWARDAGEAPESARQGARALLTLARSRRFWALSAMIFLWSFYPFLGTAQFYYQSGALKLGPVFIGFLGTLGGVSGAAGAAFYGRVVGRRWPTSTLVRSAVWIAAPLSLLYLAYRGAASAAVITVVFGFAGVALRLSLMDLAAQACPAGAEATAFAAYMAVFNLAASASNTAGGQLYDRLLQRFAGLADPAYAAAGALMLIGSAATAACWPLLPLVLE